MTIAEQPKASGLFARVQAILFRPAAEWEVIDAEPATVQGLFVGYACILAAITPIAGLIGRQVFGIGAFGIVYRPPLIASIVGAIVGYVLALAAVFVLALIIDALAPSFDGQRDRIQAFKVAVYSSTAGWVAGIVTLIPMLSILAVIGALYGLYLLYLGLPRLMKAPQSKALGYTVVTVVAAIVLYVVVAMIVAAIGTTALFGGMAAGGFRTAQAGTVSGVVHVNGAAIDVGRMQAAATALQRSQASGKPLLAIAPTTLESLMPANLAGLPRTDLEASSASAAGMGGSNVEAVYQKGQARLTLRVTDMAAAGAIAGMAGAMNVSSDRQTPTGYERVGLVGGRMTDETFDNASHAGKYSIIVANRFAVEAEGQNEPMDAIKSAVATIDPGRLEALARG